MTITARYPDKQFTPCPAGRHAAVCVDVIDLGLVATTFGPKYRIRFAWQVAALDPDTGRRFDVIATYNNSMHKSASLRAMLEHWHGRPFTEADAKACARDLEVFIGRPALIDVVHQTSADGNRVFATLTTINPLPVGQPRLVPLGYTRAKDRPRQPAPTPPAGGSGAVPPATAPVPDLDTPLPDTALPPDVPLPDDGDDDISFAFGANTGDDPAA